VIALLHWQTANAFTVFAAFVVVTSRIAKVAMAHLVFLFLSIRWNVRVYALLFDTAAV
jgi:hypothetical protein